MKTITLSDKQFEQLKEYVVDSCENIMDMSLEWADSDFHDGGTGGSGHKFKVKRSLAKNLSAGATYFLTETESGDAVNTLQLDLVSKF